MIMLTQEETQLAIELAIQKLMDKDSYLFEVDVNERTLTHRMAIYLEEEISKMEAGWNVDCEYNRDVTSPKEPYSKRLRLHDDPPPRDYVTPHEDENAITVFPDIIVHIRGRSGEEHANLVVIEVKKTTSSVGSAYDKEKKLPAYLKYLKYKYAYFVTLHTQNECDYTVELIGQQD